MKAKIFLLPIKYQPEIDKENYWDEVYRRYYNEQGEE